MNCWKGILIGIVLFFLLDFCVDRVMLHGVNEYYGFNQNSKILLIGHSHLMLATDKNMIEKNLGVKVSKYTREGVNVADRKIMIQQFLNSGYADSLEIVLYGVDLCSFTGEGLSENSYKLFYPFMDDDNISNYIHIHADRMDYWLHKIVRTARYNDDGIKNGSIRGWRHNWSNLKNGQIDIDVYKQKLADGEERHIQMNAELIADFEESVGMLTSKGVKVILVNTPTLDLLNNFEPDKYRQITNWFTLFAAKNKLVEYWDFNPQYSSHYDIFYDRLHLNAKGQRVITQELIVKLSEMGI